MVSCGGDHTLVLTGLGQVFSFGQSPNGQLGLGTRLLESRSPALISALSGVRVANISSGENHSAVISESGQLYTFGDGRHGKLCLAVDTLTNHFAPTLSERFKDLSVTAVHCGGCHTMVAARPASASGQGQTEVTSASAGTIPRTAANGHEEINIQARIRHRKESERKLMPLRGGSDDDGDLSPSDEGQVEEGQPEPCRVEDDGTPSGGSDPPVDASARESDHEAPAVGDTVAERTSLKSGLTGFLGRLRSSSAKDKTAPREDQPPKQHLSQKKSVVGLLERIGLGKKSNRDPEDTGDVQPEVDPDDPVGVDGQVGVQLNQSPEGGNHHHNGEVDSEQEHTKSARGPQEPVTKSVKHVRIKEEAEEMPADDHKDRMETKKSQSCLII